MTGAQANLFDLLAPASPPVPSSDGGVESRHARTCDGPAAAPQRPDEGIAGGVTQAGHSPDQSERNRDRKDAGVAPGPSEASVHWLVVGTTRARTGCGLLAPEYSRVERSAVSVEGYRFRCTHDAFDGTVTCDRCLELMR